jgi:competence protein ComEC
VYNSGKAEHVQITNLGAVAQDMSGWSVSGSKGDERYTFPTGCSLGPGASMRLHSGTDGIDAPPDDIYWTIKTVWNNTGETVYLWDAQGTQVDSSSY